MTPDLPDLRESLREEGRQFLLDLARDLVKSAEAMGFVLTIEQMPLFPPAMGNHTTVCRVRDALVRP